MALRASLHHSLTKILALLGNLRPRGDEIVVPSIKSACRPSVLNHGIPRLDRFRAPVRVQKAPERIVAGASTPTRAAVAEGATLADIDGLAIADDIIQVS